MLVKELIAELQKLPPEALLKDWLFLDTDKPVGMEMTQ